MADSKKCVCGSTWTEEKPFNTIRHCYECGRTFQNYTTGSMWVEDPAVVAVNRLYRDGQAHFFRIEKEIRTLKRQNQKFRQLLGMRGKK